MNSISFRDRFFRALLPGIAFFLTLASAVRADQELPNYFIGKTITYLVPGKPGGGYDTYARLIARHLAVQMPGTRFVIQNTPGAGGLLAAHQLYKARPDGLTLASINSGLIYAQLAGSEALRFDLRELGWVGKSASDTRVLITGSDSFFASLTDLRKTGRPALLGTNGVGSASYNETQLVKSLLDLNVRIIPGFRGENSRLAIMRGDLDGRMYSYSSVREFVEKGHAAIVLQVSGATPLGNGIPLARDFAENPDSSMMFDVMDAVVDLGRLTAAPPGVPEARLAVLRTAYGRVLRDPVLLQEAADLQLSIAPADGAEVTARLDQIFNLAEQYRSFIRNATTSSLEATD